MYNLVNPGRERILQRIGAAFANRVPSSPTREYKSVFPPVDDLLERFESECKGNLTDFLLCKGNTRERLLEVLNEIPAGALFAQDTHELRELLKDVERKIRWSNEGPPQESDVATITGAHALIAQTGSLLVSSGCGGRGATVVAPVHVVIAGRSQLMADLDEALRFASEGGLAERHSFLGLITGCSRTGDIEKLLVLGAHGPKRLIVLLDTNA